ncbi:hypothetical protein A6A06_15260 [Streptomyces sp. CB02923]|uniref:DUF5954 family protein n=1 Tax=Streptomyces sp. CB02923 TaxID=1718985 RepID=UPI00093BFF28|nr:DUF5954 family protein [Streptomyces sp. CB02923]OKI02398.1 hypothetical protein A6A06_15260 [Streptomyces sp. CB02923]
MGHENVSQGGMRRIVVRHPKDPVEAVMEADALDAALGTATILVRGPLFGVAAQDAGQAPRWQVVSAVEAGCPQQARDCLNSSLWYRAKDEARNREERCALLAAVARLESECVDDLTVLGTRYRIVRAEEYAGTGPDGIEQPRPTDPEPTVPDWDRSAKETFDDGLVLDPDAPVTPSQAAERLALRSLAYTGSRFPENVCGDSRQALQTHPDVVLLPTVFRIVEKSDPGWQTGGGLHASAHGARRSLDFALTWLQPRLQGFIAWNADDRETDARTVAAEGTDPAAGELAEYVRAADRLRSERANQVEARGTVHRICRVRRLLRWGPDGPEGPRPSDTNSHTPERMHPRIDEDGNIHHD